MMLVRPAVALVFAEVVSGVMVMSVLLVAVVAQLRHKTYERRAPFVVGAVALGGLFRGIDGGNTGLVWFAAAVTLILLPLVPEAVRRTPRLDR